MLWSSFLVTAILCDSISFLYGDVYKIGRGTADITGPVTEIQFFGYASFNQAGTGLHMRQFCRTFIISDDTNSIVLSTIEVGAVSEMVRIEALNQLKPMYGDLYTENNVCITGTHTHSGPGGYFDYVTYSLITFGFYNDTFNAHVNGIVQSIINAHNSLQRGYLYYNEGILLNANINRSPTSYTYNPAEEVAQYQYDVDKTMYLLKMTDMDGNPLGCMTWFAVHGTSMNNTNTLVSSDNKGYAAITFEQSMNGNNLIGNGPFVAAFAQGAQGDVSPNTNGPICIDSGDQCDRNTSTCHGETSLCIAFGPGKDMTDSTRIIGGYQYTTAKQLFDSATEEVQGSIQFIHQHVDMTNIILPSDDNSTQEKTTCRAAMGFGFAGGTTDGSGKNPFHQATGTNPYWDAVIEEILPPTTNQISCQLPKPILLDTGDLFVPLPWQPAILPIQELKIGNVLILAVPGEVATMSGRRLTNAVTNVVQNAANPIENLHVIVQSHSNAYSSYITTIQEYTAQRYESASTLYGPHTLEAYTLLFQNLTENILSNSSISPGPPALFLLKEQIQYIPGVLVDSPGLGKHFGQVVTDVKPQYSHGDLVSCSFVSGNPRNSVLRSHNFFNVDMFNASNQWQTVATDANWETKFMWNRTVLQELTSQSQVNCTWSIPTGALPGKYRIQHFGFSKPLLGEPQSYTGTSSTFTVLTT